MESRNMLLRVLLFLINIYIAPFKFPFLAATAVIVEDASCPNEFSSEAPPPVVKRSPIKDI